MTDCKKAAREYVQRGWSVIPVGTNKRPLIDWKEFQSRPPLMKEIDAWPDDANVGIVTGKVSGLGVIDVDSDKGLAGLKKILPDGFRAPTVHTPRGGIHLYCQYTPAIRNKVGAGIEGVDFRGEGGFVCAPPSMGAGKQYHWNKEANLSVPLPQVPDEYIRLVIQATGAAGEKAWKVADGKMFTEGRRNNDFFHFALKLAKGKADRDEAYAYLKVVADTSGFPDRELRMLIDSAYERATREDRNLSTEIRNFVDVTDGTFQIKDLSQALNIINPADKNTLRVVLHRLKKDGLIEKSGRRDGEYIKVINEAQEIDWWNAATDEFPVELPLELDQMASVHPGGIIAMGGVNDTGKGHPDGTPILTVNGWVPVEKLSIGDTVFSADGTQTKVTGVFPRGPQQCFRFTFNDRSSIVTDWEHLWDVQFDYYRRTPRTGRGKINKNFGRWSTHPTYVLLGRCGMGRVENLRGFLIPRNKPLDIEKKPVTLDPYVLGLLLGDGCFRGRGCGSVSFSTADKELLDSIGKLYEVRKTTGKYDYRVVGAYREVNALGLTGHRSWEKFVPVEYLLNDTETRLSLLRGLLDTDGDVSPNGVSVSFTSTSRQLAEDVKFLVESLGGRGVISKRTTKFSYNGVKKDGRESYRVFISIKTFNPFSLKRKADRYKPQERYVEKRIRYIENAGIQNTTCISIDHPSGLYIANDFIVTHNTAFALNIAIDNVARHPVRYISSEMDGSELHARLKKWEGVDIEEFKKIKFLALGAGNNLGKLIDTNAVNIIDYLEAKEGEYFKMGHWISEIYDALRGQRGIAVVCMQKEKGKEYARGGSLTADKSRLYISLDIEDRQSVCRIVKSKNFKRGHKPTGMQRYFQICGGWKIVPSGSWHFPEIKGGRG